MKRTRDECPDARKKNKLASNQKSGQPDQSTQSSQQCSDKQQEHIAQQLKETRERALQSFDVRTWGNGEFAPDLSEVLAKLFQERAIQPNVEDKCWHLDGTTLMDKVTSSCQSSSSHVVTRQQVSPLLSPSIMLSTCLCLTMEEQSVV